MTALAERLRGNGPRLCRCSSGISTRVSSPDLPALHTLHCSLQLLLWRHLRNGNARWGAEAVLLMFTCCFVCHVCARERTVGSGVPAVQ